MNITQNVLCGVCFDATLSHYHTYDIFTSKEVNIHNKIY